MTAQGHGEEGGRVVQHAVRVTHLAEHRVQDDLQSISHRLEAFGFNGIGLGRGLFLDLDPLGQDFREQVRTAVSQAARNNPERCHHGWIIGCDIGLEDRILGCGSVQGRPVHRVESTGSDVECDPADDDLLVGLGQNRPGVARTLGQDHREGFGRDPVIPRRCDGVLGPPHLAGWLIADARCGLDPRGILAVPIPVGAAQNLARDSCLVHGSQVHAVAPREGRDRLEFRGEVVEREPGRLEILAIVLPDLGPFRVGHRPGRVIGQFLQVPAVQVGCDPFERGEVTMVPRPCRQVDDVSLDSGPEVRPVTQFRGQVGTVVGDDLPRDCIRVINPGEDGSQDQQVVAVNIVPDQRPAGRRDRLQDLGELVAVAVDAEVLAIVRQEAAAPPCWLAGVDLDVEENTLLWGEGVF